MKNSVKIILIALIVAATVSGTIFYMMMPLPVRMSEILPQSAELTFTEQGIVSVGESVLVFPVALGEIMQLYVREGQNVQAGQPLLSVDSTELEMRLEQTQNSVRSLEAQLGNVEIEAAHIRQNLQTTLGSLRGELMALDAQAAGNNRAFISQEEILREQTRIQQVVITEYERELERAEERLRQARQLYAVGAVARIDYDAAASLVVSVSAQLDSAHGQMAIISAGTTNNNAEHFEGIRSSLNAQISGITQQLTMDTTTAAKAHFEALIAIERLNMARLEREIENAVITAPISGTITTFHAQSTNFVNGTSPIAEITMKDSPIVEVYVSTQDVGSINIGDRVRLVLRQRMSDIEFYGYVTHIDNTAVVRFSALGIEERKVNVKVEPMIPEDLELGAGFAVDATFFLLYEEDRIVVPRTAVFRDDGHYMVWVVRGEIGTLEVRAVETGAELRTDIIVVSGLSVGEFVVNNANNSELRAGVRVTNER